jgi:hypothetical protein
VLMNVEPDISGRLPIFAPPRLIERGVVVRAIGYTMSGHTEHGETSLCNRASYSSVRHICIGICFCTCRIVRGYKRQSARKSLRTSYCTIVYASRRSFHLIERPCATFREVQRP